MNYVEIFALGAFVGVFVVPFLMALAIHFLGKDEEENDREEEQ